MRGPWKVIGKLFSGRREAQKADDRIDGDDPSLPPAQHDPIEHLPAQDELSAETPSADADAKEANGQEDRAGRDRSQASLRPTKSRRARTNRPVASKANDTRSGVVAPSDRRTISSSTKPAASKPALPKRAQKPPVEPRKEFASQVADLDEEVRVLARQLAEKLEQQNAQLRSMLERFEGR